MENPKVEQEKEKLEKIKVIGGGKLGDSIRKSIDEKINSLGKEIKK